MGKRVSSWSVLKDFVWWYFIVKCNEFHPRLNLNIERCMKSREHRIKEYERIAKDRDRAHHLDILYSATITRSA